MTPPTPLAEHQWLHRLIGEWTSVASCVMGPDQPPMTHTGTETVRSMGGLWTLGDGASEHGTSLMTLGYDPVQKRFVGSFVASMMTHMWIYNGTLDAAGQVLTMDTTGPSFAGNGTMTDYQDVFAFDGDDIRTLTSRAKQPDGSWMQFMQATYTRTK